MGHHYLDGDKVTVAARAAMVFPRTRQMARQQVY